MTLPADVPTSLVQGTYSIAEADNADTGIEPQGAPLDGLQIVLTPDPPRVWTHTSSGAGVAIGPMLATTNSMGLLVNPVTGLVGLRIPSSAQAGLTGAPTIPWTAEISDPLGRVETERKTFHAPAGGTVNLPSVAPYWPDPNAGTLPQWETARADVTAAVNTAAPLAVDAALSSRWRTGRGAPSGSAPLGTIYVDLDATYGATMWAFHSSATGNSLAWRVVQGDTYPIAVDAQIRAHPDVSTVGSCSISRSGDYVQLSIVALVFNSTGTKTFFTAGPGWRGRAAFNRDGLAVDLAGTSPRVVSSNSSGEFRVINAVAGVAYEASIMYRCADGWPSAPPPMPIV